MNQKTTDETLYMKAACILCRMAERAGGVLLGLSAWQMVNGTVWGWLLPLLAALGLVGVIVRLDERIREAADAAVWGEL